MIIAWVIGLILSFLGILLLKNSRIKANERTWDQPARPERPVLKVWSLFLLILGALVPIFNIIMGVIIVVVWAVCVYGEKCWLGKEDSIADKIVKLLNKPIN